MLTDGMFVPDFVTRYSPQIKDVFSILEYVEKIYFSTQKHKNAFRILVFESNTLSK